ncbi:MAG: hypothetical protein H6824_16460 [Planctomycetaceae bacterium]|nr:hypothetical protein [Planctomycetaceae bacterium]
MRALILCGCACGLMVTLAGCMGGNEQVSTVKVTGKVYLDDELQTSGRLTLDPVDTSEMELAPPSVGGTIGSDGTYTLTTYKPGDGAAPGDYNVTLGGAFKSDDTANPEAMMAMMSGGGGGTNTLTVTIPADGSDSLDFKFVTQKGGAAPAGGGPPSPIGGAQ